MTDIRELLTAIRAWQAADKAYRAADKAYFEVDRDAPNFFELDKAAYDYRTEKYHERDKAWASIGNVDYNVMQSFVALADHVDAQAAALRASNAVMGDLHTSGAKADYPGYLIGMGDLYQLQVQIDANNALLTNEPTVASASEEDA